MIEVNGSARTSSAVVVSFSRLVSAIYWLVGLASALTVSLAAWGGRIYVLYDVHRDERPVVAYTFPSKEPAAVVGSVTSCIGVCTMTGAMTRYCIKIRSSTHTIMRKGCHLIRQ